MSVAFTARTTVARPVDQVWAALVDWDEAKHWMGDVEWLRAEGATAVGTRLTFRARGKERPSTIAGLEPGRSLVLRSQQGGVTADYRYRLEPADVTNTDIELVADCETAGAWRLVGPLVRAAMRRADRRQLDDFKRHVEAMS